MVFLCLYGIQARISHSVSSFVLVILVLLTVSIVPCVLSLGLHVCTYKHTDFVVEVHQIACLFSSPIYCTWPASNPLLTSLSLH